VLTAVIAGGAKVVGFDIVFPTSIEQSEIAFDDGKLGARLRGFDRDFLRALALGAHDGKVVLGEAQHCDLPILPSPGQRIAVGQSANIRSLNVYNDPDDVVRRIPLSVMVDGNPQWSIVVELTSRALGSAPETAADGTVTLSGYRIPTLVPNTMTLNFGAGPDPIPTYSLADLRACIEVLAPPDLVRFMNEYLSAMTDIIQEQGGFVDKYTGDAISALPCISASGLIPARRWSAISVRASASIIR